MQQLDKIESRLWWQEEMFGNEEKAEQIEQELTEAVGTVSYIDHSTNN
jgi:hypothetical protein